MTTKRKKQYAKPLCETIRVRTAGLLAGSGSETERLQFDPDSKTEDVF